MIKHAEGCTREDWKHKPPFACTVHGPCCDFNLTDHPLPPQGRGALSKGPYPDWDFDDVHGEMADLQSAREYGR